MEMAAVREVAIPVVVEVAPDLPLAAACAGGAGGHCVGSIFVVVEL